MIRSVTEREPRMKKTVLLLLAVLTAYAAVETIPDPYTPIDHYRLDNGMNVYLLSDPKSKKTGIEVDVGVGMEAEDDASSGLSHLVEHMVFRDRRVPHRDYVNYIEEEGGSNINGYTGRYKTAYIATIDSNKSYWIATVFAQMMFDKNITADDLESERGVLQTEIGEYSLPKRLLWDLFAFFDAVFPDEDFYSNEFIMARDRRPPAPYYAQRNNARFTFDEVMRHYATYYYPSNMTLKIAGNFDRQKMKQIVDAHFGRYRRGGSATVKAPSVLPKLNHKPSLRFYEGVDKNRGFIGAKYVLDDYKKYLIIDAYTANAASRLQEHLRNKLGQNYSVNAYMFNDRKAGVASVAFDGLRNNFEENIRRVKALLVEDAAVLDDAVIDAALREYRDKTYGAAEHDVRSLMALVRTQEYLNTEEDIGGGSSYDVFKSITHDDFRQVVSDVFVPQNRYSVIYRDYFFFPYDTIILTLLSAGMLLLVYFKLNRIDYWAKGLHYTKRDLLFDRRLSNRFLGFLLFIFVLIMSTWAWEWIKFGVFKLLTGDPYYPMTVDVPYSYVVSVLDAVLMIVFFAAVYKFGFSYYARLDAGEEALYLVGNNIAVLDKKRIEKVDVVRWSPDKFFKIKGSALLFWKPLTMITMTNGQKLYLRSGNAAHLKEDIEKGLRRQA